MMRQPSTKNPRGNRSAAQGGNHAVTEALCFAAAVLFAVYELRSMLLQGRTTLTHDNLLWNYPVFQFFAESLINGRFPSWNPFSHGGEPFYPLMGQLRLMEPVAMLVIYIGHFLSSDIIMLFNWNRFVQCVIVAIGAYLVLRPFACGLLVRLMLIPVLLFSSFMLGSFQQDAILNQFMWTPYIALFLLRVTYRRDYGWHNWLALAGLIGLNWQSYFFSGTWIFILFFAVALAVARRDLLRGVFESRWILLKLAAAAAIIFAMALPNAVLMKEKGKYIFPARMVDDSIKKPIMGPLQYEAASSGGSIAEQSINMPYGFIKMTGTFSRITDLVQIIAPDGNNYLKWPGRSAWGQPSEAYIYLGFTTWAIAVLGIVAARDELKKVWLLLLAAFGLLMLGPYGVLHRVLYYVYPPVWFVRHTHAFVMFFVLSLLYFYVIGLNHLFLSWRGRVFAFKGAAQKTGREGLFGSGRAGMLSIAVPFLGSLYLLLAYKSGYDDGLARFADEYLWVLLVSAFAVLWFIRRNFGDMLLYYSVICGHIAVVLVLTANRYLFLKYLFVALIVPAAAYAALKPKNNISIRVVRHAGAIVLVVFAAAFLFDLVHSFRKTAFLYEGTEHPGKALALVTTAQKPRFNPARVPYIKSPEGGVYNGMRYMSILYRVPAALSSVSESEPVYDNIAKKTYFDAKKAGRFMPVPYKYYANGVYRKTGLEEEDGVMVMESAPRSGKSQVIYDFPDISGLRGAYVWFTVWVKSSNTHPGAVQAVLQLSTSDANVKPEAVRSYGNKGEWQKLTVGKYLGRNTTRLTLSCNVSAEADAPAFFKDTLIEVKSLKEGTLDYGLTKKRWSSFLLTGSYFRLVNSGIEAPVLEKIFAIGDDAVQFKKTAAYLKDEDVRTYLDGLGVKRAVEFLKDNVIIDGGQRPDGAPAGGARDVKAASGFSYTVDGYDYDTLELTADSALKGLLYWADGFDRGWRAYVNGAEVPVYRANVNFKAVPLPRGRSKVRFVYSNRLFELSLYAFYGAFATSVIGAAALAFAGRKR